MWNQTIKAMRASGALDESIARIAEYLIYQMKGDLEFLHVHPESKYMRISLRYCQKEFVKIVDAIKE